MDNSVVERRVGLLGATSLVGKCLLPLLARAGWRVTAFSRRAVGQSDDGVEWRRLPSPLTPLLEVEGNIHYWICVAPIWALPDYFGLLEAHGARRVVALSSTSRFTKDDSSDPEERAVARRFADAEKRVQVWAQSRGVEWVILRPTLIYGRGQDKNITEMLRLIRRFGFFPLFGEAVGLRQPVHADDVAGACFAALNAPNATNRDYNISGGETLTYREMVCRVFAALGRRPRLLPVPLGVFRLAVACLRLLPRYRHWSAAMAERMNADMIFDHTDATHDLGFSPRPYRLEESDLPGRLLPPETGVSAV